MGVLWGGFGNGLGCTPLGRDPNPYALQRIFFIHFMCASYTSARISEHLTWLALFLQSKKQTPWVGQRLHIGNPLNFAWSFKLDPANVLHCSPSFILKSSHWCSFLIASRGCVDKKKWKRNSPKLKFEV
jgi:hypothetical protein